MIFEDFSSKTIIYVRYFCFGMLYLAESGIVTHHFHYGAGWSFERKTLHNIALPNISSLTLGIEDGGSIKEALLGNLPK